MTFSVLKWYACLRDEIEHMESRDVGIESAGWRPAKKKNARKTATAVAVEEKGALFRMREKENEGEFESGKTVG